MATPEVIIWLVVLVVGIPSTWWNPTAGALVICWIVGEVSYLVIGDNLPILHYLIGDAFVLLVIFAKAEHRFPLEGCRIQLWKTLLDSVCMDRWVLAIFVIMWMIYAVPLHPYFKWWALYYLLVAQFLATGWEALHPYPCDYSEVGDQEDTRLMCQTADGTP